MLKFPVLAGGFILQMENVNIRALQNLGRPAMLQVYRLSFLTEQSKCGPSDIEPASNCTTTEGTNP